MKFLESSKYRVVTAFAMVMTLSACSFDNVVKFIADVLTVAKAVAVVIAWFPPAADLQYFDAQLAAQNISAQNITITNTSGNVEITIKDENDGTLLGQNIFAYSVSQQGQISFSNPSQVTNWIRSYSSYNGFVEVSFKTVFDIVPPPEGQSGTVSSTMIYNGSPVSSASASYYNSGESGCYPGTYCEIQ